MAQTSNRDCQKTKILRIAQLWTVYVLVHQYVYVYVFSLLILYTRTCVCLCISSPTESSQCSRFVVARQIHSPFMFVRLHMQIPFGLLFTWWFWLWKRTKSNKQIESICVLLGSPPFDHQTEFSSSQLWKLHVKRKLSFETNICSNMC